MVRREPYADRDHAGQVLAGAVADVLGAEVLGAEACLVLALPRGGVPVAAAVAARLAAPLGLMLVRKLGAPGRPELAMGAIARTGEITEVVRHQQVIIGAGVDDAEFDRVRRREEAVLAERAARYRDTPPSAVGRILVLVDDGLATGMTALAAVAAARSLRPSRVVVAAPVGSPQAVAALEQAADLVVCPLTPRGFTSVSLWYRHFDQLTDAEVVEALSRSHET